jgi:hypothetical protein
MRPLASHQPVEAAAGFSGRTACCAPFRAVPLPRRRSRVSRAAAVVRAERAAQSAAGDTTAAAAATALSRPQQQQQPQRQAPDPYQLAGQRLRSLLSGVGNGEVRGPGGAAVGPFVHAGCSAAPCCAFSHCTPTHTAQILSLPALPCPACCILLFLCCAAGGDAQQHAC